MRRICGTLFHVENDDLAVGAIRGIFDTQLNVFEKLRVPERLEIAAKGLFVVGIALAAENAGLKSVAADSAVAVKFDAFDHALRLCISGLLYRPEARRRW